MIAEAGQLSAVTVATSMAGRGTDIKLSKEVHDIGGLAVIINEHMDNSRVDRQLRGRSGRQGDPGYSQIFVSLDDDLVKRWSNSNLAENKNLQTMDASKLESSALFKKRVKSIVNKAQRVSEETAMKNREMANEFEKVLVFNEIKFMLNVITYLKQAILMILILNSLHEMCLQKTLKILT